MDNSHAETAAPNSTTVRIKHDHSLENPVAEYVEADSCGMQQKSPEAHNVHGQQ